MAIFVKSEPFLKCLKSLLWLTSLKEELKKFETHIPMKKLLFAAIFSFVSFITYAQSGLLIQSNSKGLYLAHTVAAKENFYSIGRLYNISPKDIAAFNGVDMAAGLSIGQNIQIPLKAANFTQTAVAGTPVYYTVGEGEGLYRVSVNSGKVQMENIRKWNNLRGDAVTPGQKLIVGYLVSTEMASNPIVAKAETPAPQPQKSEPVAVQTREEPQRTEPAKTEPAPKPKTTTTASNTPRTAAAASGSGYFKNQFEHQSRNSGAGRDVTVTSGIFKTSSGWQDSKYYALIDKVEPGTIVQVINPSNNKAIYAKVLGEMSGIRQNAGLELRISNAAASALEVSDTEKFIVRVAY